MYRDIKMMSSTPIVSIMKEERLVQHSCEVYLTFVTIDKNNKVKLSELLVVCEFPNVFSNEFPVLSPRREIEFSIHLVLDT